MTSVYECGYSEHLGHGRSTTLTTGVSGRWPSWCTSQHVDDHGPTTDRSKNRAPGWRTTDKRTWDQKQWETGPRGHVGNLGRTGNGTLGTRDKGPRDGVPLNGVQDLIHEIIEKIDRCKLIEPMRINKHLILYLCKIKSLYLNIILQLIRKFVCI